MYLVGISIPSCPFESYLSNIIPALFELNTNPSVSVFAAKKSESGHKLNLFDFENRHS